VLNEKKRKMVPLWKIHPQREILQQQWLEDRRRRLDTAPAPAVDGDLRRY